MPVILSSGFVSVGNDGVGGGGVNAYYSTDNGQDWTGSSIFGTGQGNAIAYGDGVFIAVGDNSDNINIISFDYHCIYCI